MRLNRWIIVKVRI